MCFLRGCLRDLRVFALFSNPSVLAPRGVCDVRMTGECVPGHAVRSSA